MHQLLQEEEQEEEEEEGTTDVSQDRDTSEGGEEEGPDAPVSEKNIRLAETMVRLLLCTQPANASAMTF